MITQHVLISYNTFETLSGYGTITMKMHKKKAFEKLDQF